MDNLVNEKNIDRFSGFSELYNNSRPTPPKIITEAVLLYFNSENESAPDAVVDLGSGTGLSTLIWKDVANTIIGIEPNDDMRGEAVKTAKADNVSFQKGVSNETGAPILFRSRRRFIGSTLTAH